jgi:ATP-dependent Clp protease ATP-binding subunit ClpA
MQKNELSNLKTLGKKLKAQVFGQDEAVVNLVDSIKLAKSGLADENKPIGSFLFVGPSGVGKTEIAKQLANNLNISFVRFDMSEYQEKHAVAKLIGAPAGYVGYEDGGVLIEAVRKNPHCVLLFDEIEKAHPDIFKTFLQVMDYGTLTDNKGRKADFRNAIIIMTSNAGATVAAKSNIGFGNSLAKNGGVNAQGITDAVNDLFAPEFRNRLTKTIIFNGINDEIGRLVARKELNVLIAKLKAKGMNISFTDACLDEIVKRGVSPVYGAREIQRVVNEEIKKLFVEAIIDGKTFSKGVIDYKNNSFAVSEEKILTRV